jgi:hypothetical protein
MAEEERESFLRCAGGMEGVIEPTDAVYMPPLVWHYLDYIDLAGSFNIRFGRNPYSKFLSADNFVPDMYLQAIAEPFAGLGPGVRPRSHMADTLDEIIESFNGSYKSRLDKYHAMQKMFYDIYMRAAGQYASPLFLSSLDDEAQRRAEDRMQYRRTLYKPGAHVCIDAIEATEHPISPGGVRALGERMDTLGYTSDLIRKVMLVKFGRSSLSDLTQTEGLYFLRYLNSPSGQLDRSVRS